jgi:hypothetical protein
MVDLYPSENLNACGAYPYMDLNAKYGKTFTTMFTEIDPNKDISKTRQVHVK